MTICHGMPCATAARACPTKLAHALAQRHRQQAVDRGDRPRAPSATAAARDETDRRCAREDRPPGGPSCRASSARADDARCSPPAIHARRLVQASPPRGRQGEQGTARGDAVAAGQNHGCALHITSRRAAAARRVRRLKANTRLCNTPARQRWLATPVPAAPQVSGANDGVERTVSAGPRAEVGWPGTTGIEESAGVIGRRYIAAGR